LAYVLVAMGTWGMGSVLLFRRRPVVGLLSTLGAIWVLYGIALAPLVNDSSSARGVMMATARRIGPDAELGLVAWKEQNLLMTQSRTTNFGFRMPWKEQLRLGLAWQAEKPTTRWLLIQDVSLPACVDRALADNIGDSNRRGWWLVPMTARAHCPASPEIPFDDAARAARIEAGDE